jgi:hypothetical protein
MPARTPALTADLERVLAERDPELVEAVQNVDLSLLRWSLGLTAAGSRVGPKRPELLRSV